MLGRTEGLAAEITSLLPPSPGSRDVDQGGFETGRKYSSAARVGFPLLCWSCWENTHFSASSALAITLGYVG
jgi:hypothetical protein